MKLVGTTLILGGLAVVLSACGQAAKEPADTLPGAGSTVESGSPAGSQAKAERTGSGEGTIVSLGSKGDFVTIDHGPIDGLMGAMTMGFELVSDVDMSGLAEGDTVAFSVKQGMDGVYRVTSICKTIERGAGCAMEDATQ